MKKIVIIGGGTGLSTLARGLRRIGLTKSNDVTAVVSMADSGGFSGFLRNERGVLPPGDVMKLLLAFSHLPEVAEELLYYRFVDGSVPGHYMLTGMAQTIGYLAAIKNMQELLRCSGFVLPASLDQAHLFAETNRRVISGEGNIEKWFYDPKNKADDSEKLVRVFLEPVCRLLPEALRAIREADLIVIGPGSFYTSLIACLLVEGMSDALKDKKIVFVVNVTTHPKETPNWAVSSFVSHIEAQIGRTVNTVLCNKSVPAHLLEAYGAEHSTPVEIDVPDSWNGRQVIKRQFVQPKSEFARHNPKRLARAIQYLLEQD